MPAAESLAAASVPSAGQSPIDARVVLLTHYIPLYQVRVLQQIAAAVREFHILLSTPIEPNRDFQPDWSGLDVTVQNSWTLRRRWRHKAGGFEDQLYVHVPYDTSARLRELNPDVVMSLELGARSLGAAWYCRRASKSKLVLCTYMSERTEQNRGWLRRNLRKKLLKQADAVTYNGPSCRRYLETFDVEPSRLFHLPYAADDRTLHNGRVDRDESASRGRLLVVGQLTARKGVVRLAAQIDEYCRRHADRNIELIFAGNGPEKSTLREFVTAENLTIQLLGNVPAEDLSLWMCRSSAVIAPTLADEWMLVVNEAMHAGVPVIGSLHAQAVTTLIEDGVDGWQYDPADESTIFRSLDQYFSLSDQDLAAMRLAARCKVHSRTPAWAASGAIQAIQHVINGR
ncbi:MAG: glycosyltransferase family 4 protein [Planctomycetota bacterium]